jgi:hypothetical protein
MQHYSNQIAQMFIGYQLTLVDLPRLIDIGRGCIRVELPSAMTQLNGSLDENFTITATVQSGLDEAIVRDGLN